MFSLKFDDGNKVWRSNTDIPLAFNPNVSIAHLLLKSMEIHGSKIAQVRPAIMNRDIFSDIVSSNKIRFLEDYKTLKR